MLVYCHGFIKKNTKTSCAHQNTKHTQAHPPNTNTQNLLKVLIDEVMCDTLRHRQEPPTLRDDLQEGWAALFVAVNQPVDNGLAPLLGGHVEDVTRFSEAPVDSDLFGWFWFWFCICLREIVLSPQIPGKRQSRQLDGVVDYSRLNARAFFVY